MKLEKGLELLRRYGIQDGINTSQFDSNPSWRFSNDLSKLQLPRFFSVAFKSNLRFACEVLPNHLMEIEIKLLRFSRSLSLTP